MLLNQDNIDLKVQRAIRGAGPRTFASLMTAIEQAGSSRVSSPNIALTSLMHMQVEKLWVWADPEEVAAYLAVPSNIKQLSKTLTLAALQLGMDLEMTGPHPHMFWPCFGCNTPCDAGGHVHGDNVPPHKAGDRWTEVSIPYPTL